MTWDLLQGDCLVELRKLEENSVDALVTDPPAGISFMGRQWDSYSTDLPEPAFINWFAGFVDGEGCFSVHRKPQDTFDCQFSIGLRADDKPILIEIQRTLRIGTVADHHRGYEDNPQARFCVSSKKDCIRLAEVLRAAPLRAKKAQDFEIWLEALQAWIDHKPGEWSDMKDARERLMASRKFKEYGVVAGSPERRAFIAEMKSSFKECLRVLKPGAHGLVWALPRTSHWTATALEDAGFEVRDVILHLFGQGFPKSLDISKAIDKAAGAEREKVGSLRKSIGDHHYDNGSKMGRFGSKPGSYAVGEIPVTAPATAAAKQWQGFGTALKPASEHWILVRKPLEEKTVAANVLKWGTGGINVDGCRIPAPNGKTPGGCGGNLGFRGVSEARQTPATENGRFPANLVLSHSPYCEDDQCDIECAVLALDAQSGTLKSGDLNGNVTRQGFSVAEGSDKQRTLMQRPGSSGGASRFFYCAKISPGERNAGLEGMPERKSGVMQDDSYKWTHDGKGNPINLETRAKNHHPTVKPLKLMRYFCRMVTPPGGVILDPFAGSGSTGVAALQEGFRFIGIEREPEYAAIAKMRLINAATPQEVTT